MGFKNYFQTTVPKPTSHAMIETEKFHGALPGRLAPLDSDSASVSPSFSSQSRPPSSRAAAEGRLVDDIKHQVVINHLYKNQCSSLWIRDYTENMEGCMVRRKKNDYLFKPPTLASSSFAKAMSALNVQVSIHFFLNVVAGTFGPFSFDGFLKSLKCLSLRPISPLRQEKKTNNVNFKGSNDRVI
jgi:hypothetical protein